MSGFTFGLLCGVVLALVPMGGIAVWLDRRDERRCRIALRVDQTPAPLPGAFAAESRPVLTSSRHRTVIDVDPTGDHGDHR